MASLDERRASSAVAIHGRVMELLFVTGHGVTLSAPQVAAILGVDVAAVVLELRANRFVRYDEVTQTARLLAPRGGAGGGGGRRARERGTRAKAVDDDDDDEEEEEEEEEEEGGGENDGDGPDGESSRGSARGSRGASLAGAAPKPRRPPPTALSHPTIHLDRTETASSPLSHFTAVDPRTGPRAARTAGAGGAGASAAHQTRRARRVVTRIGSRNPPTGVLSLAGQGGGGGGGRDVASGAVAKPLQTFLTGRVGYVCAAEEFRLGEMQAYYSNLGYATRVDLGVLHVRLPESASFAKTGSSSGPAGKKAEASSPVVASPLLDGVSSPTTSSFLRQRMGNFDLFLFEYGAVVWWGSDERFFKIVETDFLLPDSEAAACMVNRYPTQLVTENYPVWCSYSLVRKESLDVDEDFRRKLRFDHFLIPFGRDGEDASLCATTMLCCAHALAQSAKIDYLELKVHALTEACAPLPRELRLRGHAHISERRLLQLRGEVLSYRLMLKSGSDLLDEPDFFWENAYLKPVFEATKEAFGIDDRVEALDNKLDASNEILSMLAEEFSQRHGARLEWIVIWLVFVEVIIGVLELAVDFKPLFSPK